MAALSTFGLLYRPGCVHVARLMIYCSQKGHILLCIALLLSGSTLQTEACMHAAGDVITSAIRASRTQYLPRPDVCCNHADLWLAHRDCAHACASDILQRRLPQGTAAGCCVMLQNDTTAFLLSHNCLQHRPRQHLLLLK